MRAFGLVTHAACSTEVLASGSDPSDLFQECDSAQREKVAEGAAADTEPEALSPRSGPCCRGLSPAVTFLQ